MRKKRSGLKIMHIKGVSGEKQNRLWKKSLQAWADKEGLSIMVCHFPPGTSKWESPTHFIRQRKLTFSPLIFFLINLVKGSYQDELDHFFKSGFGFDVVKRVVSKTALTKARMKLKYEAFVDFIMNISRPVKLMTLKGN